MRRHMLVPAIVALGWLSFVATIAVGQSNSQVQGVAAVGTSLTPIRPVAAGAQDPTGKAQFLQVEANGTLLVSSNGLSPIRDTFTFAAVVTSSGTTPVTIIAGVSSAKIYIAKFVIANLSANTHTVNLADSAGRALWQVQLLPNQSYTDDTGGLLFCTTATSLQFWIDSGGSSTDCSIKVVGVVK